MICQVKRKSGIVEQVLAPNEKKSMAYESLLDIVSRAKDRTVFENHLNDWVGKYIKNTTDNKELALGLYKQLYSPLFKDWFGNWTKLAEAVGHKDDIKGFYSFIFDQDPQQVLFEAAVQANSNPSKQVNVNNLPILTERQSFINNNILKENSELNNLFKGNTQLYQSYLDNIFPNSKVKDVVFHGSPNNFDKFNITDKSTAKGLWFTANRGRAKIGGSEDIKSVYNVVLDIRDPKYKDSDGQPLFTNPDKYLQNEKGGKHDAAIFEPTSRKNLTDLNSEKTILKLNQVVVFDPKQVHILGNKEDIDNAKKYLNNNRFNQPQSQAEATFGEPIVKLAQELFPNAKVGDQYSPVVGATDINGEPLLINDRYTNPHGEQRNILNQNAVKPSQSLYQLTDSSLETIPSRASRKTIAKVEEFLNRLGVKLESVTGIVVDGQKIGSNGMADAMNRLVQVVEGKEDTALTEEAFHVAVELIAQKDPTLFKEMMNKVNRYNMYDKVLKQYRGTYLTNEGKPDINKIKKETIAKILAEMFIRNNDQVTEKPEFLDQTRNWWQKVLDSLKKFFNRLNMNIFKEDPFDTALGVIKDKEATYDPSKVNPNEGAFLQKQQEPVVDKLLRMDQSLVQDEDGKFELNGKSVRSVEELLASQKEGRKSARMEEKSSEHIKADREFKRATEGAIKTDIDDILTRLVNEDGYLREEPLNKTNPSAIKPGDDIFYTALETNIKDRIATYDPQKTRFLHNLNIYNEGSKLAANVDFIAITDKGKVDILQFKAPEIKQGNNDISYYKQEAYGKELEEIKKILEHGYNIRKADFNQTRTIPIIADYSRVIAGDIRSPLSEINDLKIGNVNVNLVKEDILLPIPSISESTGNTQFDDLISKLRGLLQRIIDRRDPNISPVERQHTIENLLRSIKKLQVQRNTTALISSAKLINKRQDDRIIRLSKIVEELDPTQASIEEMSKIASQIMEDFEESEIYAHMDDALQEVFTEDTAENKEILSQAANIALKARSLSKQFLNLAVELQTRKYAAKVNIRDEFLPEKQLTWYRRMVRSLSQSHTTAGKLLSKLVDRINESFHIQFQGRLTELQEIHKDVVKWLNGRNIDTLYHKIFRFDDKGRWQGTVIKQYDPQFYKELGEALEKGNAQWVRDNVDMNAYNEWFQKAWREKAAAVKGVTWHENEADNRRIIAEKMDLWYNIYNPEKGFANKNNYKIKEFPLDKHFSKEYKELKDKPENEPLLRLYNHWNNRLKESIENGMIDEHNGWSWFPNVRRNLIEKMTTAKAGGKFYDFLFGNTLIDVEDSEFGKIDPLTKKPINEVHAQYVHDLGQKTKDTDGKYFTDFSAKSMDIFKVMALWDREILKYNLKTESEGLAKMLLFTEQNRKSLQVKSTGKLLTNPKTGLVETNPSNEENARYLQEHLEAVYYGKSTEGSSAFTFELPVKKIAEKINKIAGRTVVSVPENESVTLSGVKALGFLNRWMVFKTLGVNVLSPMANLFGGTFNTLLNQGRYFNKADFAKAQIDLTSARFFDSERYKKLAGILAYIQPYVEDKTVEATRHLSVSLAVRQFSSDWLMAMMRASDKGVNMHIAIAFINNSMVRNGEIRNIREVAREELDHEHRKYGGNYQDTVAWNKEFEAKVEELKNSPEALLNIATIKDDKIQLPGIDLHNPKTTPDTVIKFRSLMLQTAQDALGNTSKEDLSLYKRSMVYQSIAMFKNWIPRMVDVRGQSLRYNAGTDQYEWGRVRMLGTAIMNMGFSSVAGLFKALGGNYSTIIEAAKAEYQKKIEQRQAAHEDFDITEAEFIDMYVKGVSAQFKELGLAMAFIGILIAARLYSPDADDDPTMKGFYKWSLRGLDKLQDEVSFFYNPQSFSDIVNGSIFPAASLLLDTTRFFDAMVAKGFYEYVLGDDQRAGKQHPTKYLMRMFPITKEMLNYLAIMDTDLAKSWDLRVSSRNGSSR